MVEAIDGCNPDLAISCDWQYTDKAITITEHKVCGLSDTICIKNAEAPFSGINGEFSKNENHDPLATVGDGAWAYYQSDNSGPQENLKLIFEIMNA